MDNSMVLALASLVAWLLSFAVGVLKAREWVEFVALTALQSGEGRKIVLNTLEEKHGSIEEKLDQLNSNLDHIAERLEARIETLSQRVEMQMNQLSKDYHDVDVRLSVIEGGK